MWPNKIPTENPKLLNKVVSNQLGSLFNFSISYWIFPNILKASEKHQIHKKYSELNYPNYRLIYLLSNIDKVFDGIKYNMIFTFLKKNELTYSFQFGVRQKDSIPRKQLGSGNCVCDVFMDFMKTFDTADHHILLKS